MKWIRGAMRAAAALAVVAALSQPVSATTMIRMGLEGLTAENQSIVVGRILDVQSYWNSDGSFILTDVRVLVQDVLKGDSKEKEFTITVMGGNVGEISTLIVAGPDLEIGKDYVLFLNPEDLPGVVQVRTVRDLAQGVFDVVDTPSGPRAISQASRHPLMPDVFGYSEAPGGSEGLPFDFMTQKVRQLAGRR
jgi:hypothetical protein